MTNSIAKSNKGETEADSDVAAPYADDLTHRDKPLVLDAQATLLSFPGPAVLVDWRLETLSMNKAGEVLSHLISLGDDAPMAEKLRSAVREAVILDMPSETRLEVVGVDADVLKRSFDVSILPCHSEADVGNSVLILGRETTLESSITDALVHSRELFQDLVKCSSDIAWETSVEGRFEFVSIRGSSPFSAKMLNGVEAMELIDHEKSDLARGMSPFSAQFPIEDMEVWLRAEDGSSRCMLTTAVPVINAEGETVGARGACVDVTELRSSEMQLKAARRREELVDRIVETIRAEFDPAAMMRTAALEIGDVLEAEFGCVFMAKEGDVLLHIGGSTGVAEGSEEVLADEIAGSVSEKQLLGKNNKLQIVEEEREGNRVLICGTVFGGTLNGAVMLWRRQSDKDWEEDDRLLLYHIGSHMGIALAQAAHADALEKLSRVDPMTGLLNRRAFFDDAKGCFARNERSGNPVAYVYLDLDNFKTVNDTLGHGVGDTLLQEFATTLHALVRRGDLAVRLGGDEFGLLLDNCTVEGAGQKAEIIAKELGRVVETMGLPQCLSVSAGIALWQPGAGENIEQVMERADGVLYDAKRSGKGAWRVADEKPRSHGEEEK